MTRKRNPLASLEKKINAITRKHAGEMCGAIFGFMETSADGPLIDVHRKLRALFEAAEREDRRR